MIRFIKMWLILRLLRDDEDNFISSNAIFSTDEGRQKWKNGERPFVGLTHYINHYSVRSLWRGILPSFLRKFFWRPLGKGACDCSKQKGITQKINAIDSLILSANSLGYLDTKPPEAKKNDKVLIQGIRLSYEGDEFITYFGGIQAFIKKYKEAFWIILIICLVIASFSPTLRPWVIKVYNLIHG